MRHRRANVAEDVPFPLTVTGVMARFCTVAAGEALTVAERAPEMAMRVPTVFIVDRRLVDITAC